MACLLFVAGFLLWHQLSALLIKQDIPVSNADLLSITVLIATIVLLMLATVVILVQRYLLHRVHLLLEYVRGQQQGIVSRPPPALLKNHDDIALLTGDIHSLLETLKKITRHCASSPSSTP